MLKKLSKRNAKRQAMDYIIYIITLVITVVLMLSFNMVPAVFDCRGQYHGGHYQGCAGKPYHSVYTKTEKQGIWAVYAAGD